MYHQINKNSSYFRNALYKEYKQKCIYCGVYIQLRNMHVDHIIPQKMPCIQDEEIKEYLLELESEGFIPDSIENFLPSCPACNNTKRNSLFKVANLRYYHEIARGHVHNILKIIELQKNEKQFFYEPIDENIWKIVDFSFQRDISHAIMGYRLTSADVQACPEFSQVERIEKQIRLADYVVIQGETGCGKSISLFQTAFRFWNIGWKVYQLKNDPEIDSVILPNNTEKSIYIVDDAQVFKDYVIDDICKQARPNRKVIVAKTVTDSIGAETILLTNKDSVNTLYQDFLKRKNIILPIVRANDRTIGVNMFDTPIEHRIESAKEAKTPWQFTYILRGGWRSMKEAYFSICKHNNCDLLSAIIASFQILLLDNSVSLDYINKLTGQYNLKYKWTTDDISYLVRNRIVISEDDIRILHLESASIIVTLFFDSKKNEKSDILLRIIENEFINHAISPLGIVWLCNVCRRDFRYYYDAEELFLTDKIINSISGRIKSLHTSEEVRNTLFLLDKILISDREKNRGIQIFEENEKELIRLLSNVDSVSAWGFKDLLNSLYNQNKKIYMRFVKAIDWKALMKRMMKEQCPNYYSWGGLFNRGLSLIGKKKYSVYSEEMYSVMSWIISKTRIYNIVPTTWFISKVAFLNYDKVHDLMQELQPIYKNFFDSDIEEAIHIFDFDFMNYILGLNHFENISPTEGQRKTANMIIDAIPKQRMANVISNSNMQEWSVIRDVLYLIYQYNKDKYIDIINYISLDELSVSTENSWDSRYEICMIIDVLWSAKTNIAQTFIRLNLSKIECFYSNMIAIDAKLAIKVHKQNGIPLEIFTEHWWGDSLSAIKALLKVDAVFADMYLSDNAEQIAERYNKVTALDFSNKYLLDILKLIKQTNICTYNKIIEHIDKDKILNNWDNCGGINPRKKYWIAKRKKEFLDMIS